MAPDGRAGRDPPEASIRCEAAVAGHRAADRDRGADVEWLLATLLRHYGPQYWWPARTRLEVMAGAILTQRTQWPVAAAAAARLRRAGFLSWPRFGNVREATLAALIRPCGDHGSKARRLVALGAYLRRVGGPARLARLETGALREQLLGVHGVGPETADAILLYAYGRPVFVADAYSIRLLSRLGWLGRNHVSARYAGVHKWVTASLTGRAADLGELHALIVAHGKVRCRARPRCDGCPLAPRCAAGKAATGSRSPDR